jgi:EpsG family
MIDSYTLFILLEFAYLVLFFIYEFTNLKLVVVLAYVLAGFKYSISALQAGDMLAYKEVYNSIGQFNAESFYRQEGYTMEESFLNLLYIAKLLHIPLIIFHFLEIVVFLLSINFLCQAFVPKYQATKITLLFGFFPVGGELCFYLLRQLLSTALVFTSMGFLFRDKPIKALCVFASSLLFHSSAIIYTPLFIAKLIKNNLLKILLLSFIYGIYIYMISNIELGGQLLTSLTGDTSIYYTKYQLNTEYTQVDAQRGSDIGVITAIMLFYFVLIGIWKINIIKKSKLWLYYSFTFIFTGFYIILNELNVSWIASRINFISDILLFTSNMFLTIELFLKYNDKLIFSALAIALFWISVLVLIRYHELNGILFRI